MSGYESDTCGRSYTIRMRYVWTQIFLYPHKNICGYKNLRIRVDGALFKSFSAFSRCSYREINVRTVRDKVRCITLCFPQGITCILASWISQLKNTWNNKRLTVRKRGHSISTEPRDRLKKTIEQSAAAGFVSLILILLMLAPSHFFLPRSFVMHVVDLAAPNSNSKGHSRVSL